MAKEQKEGKSRRDVIIDILLELGSADQATEEVNEEVPFEVDTPVAQPEPEPEPAPKPKRRRKSRKKVEPVETIVDEPAPSAPVAASSDLEGLVVKVGDMVDTIHSGLSQSLPKMTDDLVDLKAAVDQLSKELKTVKIAVAEGNAYHRSVEAKLNMFREGFSGFEQALILGGLIQEAPFTEATATWEDS